MNNENERGNLQKILGIVGRIERLTVDMLYDDFMDDQMLVEAVAFNLVKLCEAVDGLNEEEKQSLEGVQIDGFGELKQKLLNEDGEAWGDLVWGMVTDGVPVLKERLDGGDE